MLDRKGLAALAKPKIEPVETEGHEAFVRSVPAKTLLPLRKLPEFDQGARLLVASLCNEKGEPILTDDDLPTVQELGGKVFNDLLRAVLKVNGLSAEGFEENRKN